MEFARLKAPSLTDLFVSQIEKMILTEKLKIGEKLPSERELAETMQVSRAVIKGGVAELVRKGFLIVVPRVGNFVADFKSYGNMETLMAMMDYDGGKIPFDGVKSVFEVRIALTTLALRLLIPRITDAEIDELGLLASEIGKATNSHDTAEASFAFVHRMVLLSGNILIPLIFTSFKAPVMTLGERYCDLYGLKAAYEKSYKLWKCISKRDIDGAIAWLEYSLNNSIDGDRQVYY
jgi:Transcriptional regulators